VTVLSNDKRRIAVHLVAREVIAATRKPFSCDIFSPPQIRKINGHDHRWMNSNYNKFYRCWCRWCRTPLAPSNHFTEQ